MGEKYDVNSVPALYTATATYSGEASGSRPTAFKATAAYTGEVTRAMAGNMLYTLVYEPAGTAASTDTVSETASGKGPAALIKSIGWTSLLYTGGILVLLAGCAAVLVFLIRSGAFKRRPRQPRPPKAPKTPRAPKPRRERRQPEPEPDDPDEFEYEDFEPAYADTEMPSRRRMRIPEAMRHMERPDMGGSTI